MSFQIKFEGPATTFATVIFHLLYCRIAGITAIYILL